MVSFFIAVLGSILNLIHGILVLPNEVYAGFFSLSVLEALFAIFLFHLLKDE